LALAHHRLNKPDEARYWLNRTLEWEDRANRLVPGGSAHASVDLGPHDWVAYVLLRREVETLLKAPAPGSR
jgi:hypothetical protein